MKRIFILIITAASILNTQTINFEDALKLAVKNSTNLQISKENLRINEIIKDGSTFPGNIGINASAVSPYLEFNSKGESEIKYGSVNLSIEPIPGLIVGSSADFENDIKSASISYTLLKPKREKVKAINSYEYSYIKEAEDRRDFIKKFKKEYQRLIYTRENFKLMEEKVRLLERELIIMEKRIESGLDDNSEFPQKKQDFLDQNLILLNYELELEKLELNFSLMLDLDVKNIKLKPLSLPKMEEFKVPNREDKLKEFKNSSGYFKLISNIKDKEIGLKENKMNLIPVISLGSAINTEDFYNFQGNISLTADFSNTFNKKQEIEKSNTFLTQAKRDLEEGIKRFNTQLVIDEIKNRNIIKRIQLLQETHNKNLKNVEIYKFKYREGDILKEVLEKEELFMKMNLLELNNTRTNFIIDNMN